MRWLLSYSFLVCSVSLLAAGSKVEKDCVLAVDQFTAVAKSAGKCKAVSDCTRLELGKGVSLCANKLFPKKKLLKLLREQIDACKGVMEVGLPICIDGVMECDEVVGCNSVVK